MHAAADWWKQCVIAVVSEDDGNPGGILEMNIPSKETKAASPRYRWIDRASHGGTGMSGWGYCSRMLAMGDAQMTEDIAEKQARDNSMYMAASCRWWSSRRGEKVNHYWTDCSSLLVRVSFLCAKSFVQLNCFDNISSDLDDALNVPFFLSSRLANSTWKRNHEQ